MVAKPLRDERVIATLSSAGDLTAEPGSQSWAIALRLELLSRIRDTQSDVGHLQRFMRLMEQHQGYKQLYQRNGKPFDSWHAFCTAEPPYGLGYNPEMLQLMMNERRSAQELAEELKPLAEHGEIGNGRSRVDIINSKMGGTDPDYLTARIARDHPAILDKMKAGEYTSVRAAALDAGIVKPRLSIPTDDAEAAARLLIKRLSSDTLRHLTTLLAEHIAQ